MRKPEEKIVVINADAFDDIEVEIGVINRFMEEKIEEATLVFMSFSGDRIILKRRAWEYGDQDGE